MKRLTTEFPPLSTSEENALIDFIYDLVDEMLLGERFQQLDHWLDKLSDVKLPTYFVLAVLTATLPGKKFLPNRKKFFERNAQSVIEDPELLRGLD